MINRIIKFFKRISRQVNKIEELERHLKWDIKSPKVNLGQIQTLLNNQRKDISSINEVEFSVFSQMGDDGIIQYLINKLDIPHKSFIEFGVENYTESNTRFLLINNNWSGMVMDGSKENIDFINRDIISWRYDLHIRHAFITRDNINGIISDFLAEGYDQEIGLLSIDIDGNDYWVWKEINVIKPIIIITEYNAVFGRRNAWTIPYKDDFNRLAEHKSYQYWGASLKALCDLAVMKGYYFIGCNSSGNNAYFVRKDKIGDLKPLTCEEGFRDSKFREFINEEGKKISGHKRIDLIKGMKIFNTETDQIEIIP